MARITFLSENFTGCINPTFALARKLVRRGHEVSYLARPDLEEMVRGLGFGFTPFLEEIYPKGSFIEEKREEAAGRGFLRRVTQQMKRRNAMFAEGYLKRKAEAIRPDLFIVDSALASHGIAAWATGVRVLMFYHQLISTLDPRSPPLATQLPPPDGAWSGLRVRAAWWANTVRLGVGNLVYDVKGETRRLARALKFPEERIDFGGEFWPRLRLPELVFCPPELDFPGLPHPEDVHHVEASIDFERKDAPFPFERLDPAKPLVYCSMGTLGVFIFADKSRQLLQKMIDVVGMRPDLQGVISIGDVFTPDQFRVPPNVILQRYLPQLPLLERAAACMTHCGLNTVKECIYFGVPMVAMPLFNDQPGNAARIRYHGIGEVVSGWGPAAQVAAALNRVPGDPGYRQRLKPMTEAFRRWEAGQAGAELAESILARPPPMA